MSGSDPTTGQPRPRSTPEPDPERTADEPRADGAVDESVSRALTAIVAQVQEIRQQLDRLLSIQLDRFRSKLKDGALRAASLMTLALVGVTAIVAAVLYLLSGLAGALAVAFQGRPWAGNLAAGGLVLISVWIGLIVVGRRQRKQEMSRLVKKYGAGQTRR